jgi:hypothetical protein
MEGKHSSPSAPSKITFFLRKAHDRAYFDAHILHRNVNITNVLTSATGRGLLVDWDLSIESTSVRPMVGVFSCSLHWI